LGAIRIRQRPIASSRFRATGGPIGAFLSQAEYEHYLRLKGRETQNVRIDDLPEEIARDTDPRYAVSDQRDRVA
jgi:hypothetical protein